MKKILLILTVLAATLSTLTLPAGISVRIGSGHRFGNYRHGYYRHGNYRRGYYRHYPRRTYYYRPYYRAPIYRTYPTRVYYQTPIYRSNTYPLKHCQGDDCYNFKYLTDASIKEVDVRENDAVIVLDNGMVFRIAKPSNDLTGERALIFARQDAQGNIISFRTDEFGVKVGDEGKPNYRLVIQGREYSTQRQN